jgi:uncharacterized protein (TIGR02145 family)
MKKIYTLFLFTGLLFFSFLSYGQIPALSSNSGSLSVLLIDMDGHTDNSGWWTTGTLVAAAPGYSTAQATEIFNRVSEDFRPFDINVTTIQSVFDAAPAANRQRVVITPSDGFYNVNGNSAGGVAYLGTFGGGDVPCWVFSNKMGGSAANAAEATSHELGHTLSLNHHARYNSDCSYNTGYHSGQGSGQTSWAPIMGVGYGRNITQWYNGAANSSLCTSNIQDDLKIITTTNGFDYRTDDVGNTQATATNLPLSGGLATTTKLISTNTDVDFFKISIPTAGVYSISVAPYAQSSSTYSGANLDAQFQVLNAGGTVLANVDPTSTLNASASMFFAAGDYYISVDGSGIPNYIAIGGVGAADYGSIGQYTLSISSPTCTAGFVSLNSVERCGAGSVTLSAVPSTSGTVSWFSALTGGTAIATGNSFTTPSLSSTTTYYAEVSNGTCISERTAVNGIISVSPVLSAISGPTTVQVGNTIQLSQTSNLGAWSSSNPNVASVSSSGLVTALSAGTGSVIVSYSATVGSCPTVIVSKTISVTSPTPCPGTPTVTDVEGNVYNTILIGSQCWTKENLKTSKFANNTSIPAVTIGADWTNLTTGAWCNYNNNIQQNPSYGKLYNFYAVTDSRAVCPSGWHVPDQNEYSAALNFLGGTTVAGGKLKSTSPLWNQPNTGATDFSGFSGLPVGQRLADGSFSGSGTFAGFWTVSTSFQNAISYSLTNDTQVITSNNSNGKSGQSVRCVQDDAGGKTPTIQSTYAGSSCGPGPVYMYASASKGFVNWYTTPTGGSPVYTGNSYQISLLASTTTFYVEAIYGVSISSPRIPVLATIKPLFNPGSLVSADEIICTNGDPSPITFGVQQVSADSILYQWYYQDGLVSCPVGNTLTGWTLISGAISNTYDPPSGLGVSRTYAVLVTPTYKSQGQGGTVGGNSGPVCGVSSWASGCRKVTVQPLVSYGNIEAGNQNLTYPADPSPIAFSGSPSGGTGNFSYQWYSQNGIVASPLGSDLSGWNLIQNANGSTFDPPSGLMQSISYACFVTPIGNPVCAAGAWANGVRQITVTCNGSLTLATPSAISGPAGVCRSSSGQVFTTPAIPGATSYIWTLPAGATGSSTTNSISLSFSSTYITGNICVKPANNCIQGANYCRSIVYYSAKPASPGAISGPVTGVCSGSTQVYSIAAVTNATNYNWTAPTNASIISGQGTTTATVSFNSSFVSGTLSVNASNCIAGTSANRTLTLASKPGTPGSIAGTFLGVCAGSTQTYSCPVVTGATFYTWTLPAGTTINSGQGTTSINITMGAAFVSGTISVSAGNGCGNSVVRSATISSAPSTPSSVSGPINGVCNGTNQNYSCPISTTGASSYNWTVPVGSTINSGQGTNAINVTLPASYLSGTIAVTAGNACGSSSARSVTVRSIPATPGTISGPASNLCNGGIFAYSIAAVAGTTSYNWIPPVGCTIQTNTGTAITMFIPAGFISGNLSVSGTNACGTSTTKTLALVGKPGTPSTILGAAQVCPSALGVPFITTPITGLTYTWTVPASVSIATGQGTAATTMNWGTAAGTIYVKATNSCGTSSNTSKAITLAACRTASDGSELAEEIQQSTLGIVVYPNPGQGMYQLKLEGAPSKGTIYVYNMQGVEILNQSKDDQTMEIRLNLENQPAGTYLIRYQTDFFYKDAKVVKE